MSSRYAEVDDLLVGDIIIQSQDAERFLQIAADEMDSVLGAIYELPLNPEPLPGHIALRLKRCNAVLASGRLILAQAAASEDGSLHAYGRSLVREGVEMLESIRTGSMQLIGLTKVAPHGGEDGGNAPVVVVGDATSGVDAFYDATRIDPFPWTDRFRWSPGA
jgi:phage gp36-like protein